MKTEDLDLAKMAKETRTGLPELKFLLGLPMPECNATTIEEVKKIHDEAERDTEEEYVAAHKRDQLLFGQLEFAETWEEIKAIYTESSTGSSVEVAAFKKLLAVSSDVEQLDDLIISEYQYYEVLVTEKLEKLLIEKVRACKKIEEISVILEEYSDFEDLEKAGIDQWASLIRNFVQAEAMFDSFSPRSYGQKKAVEKWNQLTFSLLEKVTTVEGAWEAYDKALLGSPAQQAALANLNAKILSAMYVTEDYKKLLKLAQFALAESFEMKMLLKKLAKFYRK